jgi:hypothetical protein
VADCEVGELVPGSFCKSFGYLGGLGKGVLRCCDADVGKRVDLRSRV